MKKIIVRMIEQKDNKKNRSFVEIETDKDFITIKDLKNELIKIGMDEKVLDNMKILFRGIIQDDDVKIECPFDVTETADYYIFPKDKPLSNNPSTLFKPHTNNTNNTTNEKYEFHQKGSSLNGCRIC